jgi:hypothetical protein
MWGDLAPSWTIEPKIDIITKIARHELCVLDDTVCEVKFLTEGAFNKVYTIRCGDDIKHVMRVSLPVQPRFKTMSDTATIEYVRYHTNIPAPKVWKSDASNDNELGFEWAIQDFVPGQSLTDAWPHISWLKKELLVRQVVAYFAQLFEKRFEHLGNLYTTKDMQKLSSAELPEVKLLVAEFSTDTEGLCQGRIVSMPFFWGKHVSYDVPRGPFTSSRNWLTAQLDLHLIDVDAEPDSDSDSDSDEEVHPSNTPSAIKRRVSRIAALITKFFPADEKEQFVLHHADFNSNNIFVSAATHEITGIVDWECVYTVPLYYACQQPKLFDAELDRSVCPDPDTYARDVDDDTGAVTMNDMYVRHLEEYQNQRLWVFFLEEMGRVCPEWVRCHEEGKMKAGLEEVVAALGLPMSAPDIDAWLRCVEKTGRSPSMKERNRTRQHRFNEGDYLQYDSDYAESDA